MNIGSKIKYTRIKKKLTQEALAEGIISVSYLSKIENNQVSAALDIIHLLCERLEISIDSKIDNMMINMCEKWFKILLRGEKEEAKKILPEISDNLESIDHYNIFNLVEIHKIKYYILIENLHEASHQISILKRQKYHFTQTEEYYWYKYNAYYKYAVSDFEKAFELYEKSLKLLNFDIYFYEEEVSDLYYSLGVVSSKLWNTYQCSAFVNKALEYYQRNYFLKRCAECHILLGISNRRHKEYKKAIKSYETAKNLAKMLNDISLLSLCEQNIGHLYSTQNIPNEAISHFEQCYKIRKEYDQVGSLKPVFSLVKEYYRIGNTGKSKEWLELGKKIISEKKLSISYPIALDFEIYNYLLTNYGESFKIFMNETVLPFYYEKNNKIELSKNLQLLAQYYYDDRKYKSAYILLKQSNNL